ncbi:uncharacterized protein EV422DRAFT_522195 [Fimicolochytrium jonesii]|uniref:uncharacterized protein n=1 Tax=Fimicolochytrium jonesii TaxID=1396493 RepID=UPI0022FE4742|nr:uncharacterized protein EV422DRAFT_522195 [Fimicolochytrium jonesii]KAI8823746.1 hypothetical protein EV422DRAFT_522195 [Fimicolochytrium jonesii]
MSADKGAYAPIADVPLVCNIYRPPPKYVIPDPIRALVTTLIADTLKYDFALEKSVIDDAARFNTQREAAKAERIARQQQRETERLERERRQAPGLEVGGGIMLPLAYENASSSTGGGKNTPSPIPPPSDGVLGLDGRRLDTPSPNPPSSHNPPLPLRHQEARSGTGAGGIDYLQFEQGLPPPDPWRTQDDDDDLRLLKEVMSAPDPVPAYSESATTGDVSTTRPHDLNHSTTTHPHPHIDDVVSRARALLANLNIHGPYRRANNKNTTTSATYSSMSQSPTHAPPVPAPPPKPANLNVGGGYGGEYTRSPTGLGASREYPVLPGARPAGGGDGGGGGSRVPNIPPHLQETYDKITQMGFSPDATERGIRVHGKDEKRVLDFVITFQELLPTHHPDDIQDALSAAYTPTSPTSPQSKTAGIPPQDGSRERRFLSAFVALKELGFEREAIRRALVRTGGDRERAVEDLVGGGGA